MNSDTDEALFTRSQAVFLDLEWTAWEGSAARDWTGPGEYREIVQIGTVRTVVAENFREIASLDLLVRPRRNPVLSDYFVALCGVSQEELDARGVDFPEAAQRLDEFFGGDDVYSNGRDAEVLRENCSLCGLPFIFAGNRFVNLRPSLSRALGVAGSTMVSGELPALLGFGESDAAHNALFDARAVAATVRRLRERSRI